MVRRGGTFLILLLCLGLLAAGARPASVGAQNTTADSVDVVRAAYNDLFSLFYRPLDPDTVLNAGWQALASAANSAGLAAPPSLSLSSDEQDSAFAAFAAAYEAYTRSLPPSAKLDDLAFAAADGMASNVNDDHTNFLRPAGYRSFLASLGSGDEPVGLGVQIAGTSPWLVTAVAPGGPADRAGIAAGDVIVASDGTDLTQADDTTFTRATGGAAGTTHTLTLDRSGTRLQVTVTRGPYYFPPLSSKLLPGNVGYVALSHFADAGLTLPDGTEIVSAFDRQLNALAAAGAQGLVLDLRDDGGGDTLAAEEILGRFLPPGTKTVVRYDERGHSATGLVSGPMLPVQLPLVVLVNGGSASSSELVASTLREENRALLVGERTAGALATSEILPLPEGAGLQVAVAEQVTYRTGFQIDGAGYPVDIEVADTRTADDYRAGRDPQLQAAIAALAQAPAPPAPVADSGFDKHQLDALLSAYMPDPSQIPTNDRLTSVVRTETLDLNEPDEWLDTFGFGGRDPDALEQRVRARGWIGSHMQNYNPQALVPPTVSIVVDVYASAAGAEDALQSNDFPDQQEFIPPPIQLGDDTIATRGIWLDLGGLSLSWRRGNVVLNVGYGDVPGFERMDVLVGVAKLLDQAFAANPLPQIGAPATGAGQLRPAVQAASPSSAARAGLHARLDRVRDSGNVPPASPIEERGRMREALLR